jgi:hypothetical protein
MFDTQQTRGARLVPARPDEGRTNQIGFEFSYFIIKV